MELAASNIKHRRGVRHLLGAESVHGAMSTSDFFTNLTWPQAFVVVGVAFAVAWLYRKIV